MAVQMERRFRSLEELIQSQLSELTGPGILFVRHDIKRLDVYAAVGSGIDIRDEESLKRLHWVEVRKAGNEWICNPLDDEAREPFLKATRSRS